MGGSCGRLVGHSWGGGSDGCSQCGGVERDPLVGLMLAGQ